MEWCEVFPSDHCPTMEELSNFLKNSLWDELCHYIEDTFQTTPKIEYSKCSMAPGWNVKYKKGGRALCTLYPDAERFDCMIVIGSREAAEAEAFLPRCRAEIQTLYQEARPMNGARWLMIPMTGPELLEDVKGLLHIRAGK